MNTAKGFPVCDSSREAFQRDGIATIQQAINPEWLSLLAEAAEEIRAVVKKPPDSVPRAGFTTMRQSGDYLVCENAWTFNDKLKRFVFESGIAEIAASAMGSREARLFETLVIYKEQGCDLPTAWHQDLPQHGVRVDRPAASG
jgi:ectoine hydroxylase-related dioxygenase (phytanoyl-CoA dioxygenase family)